METRRDHHSHSRPDQVRVTRVELDLGVDFERRELRGTATLAIKRRPGCPPSAPLILDTQDLTIESVEAIVAGRPAAIAHRLGKPDPVLGSALEVDAPGEATAVRIAYRTSPGAGALQWLLPSQTEGKVLPFLFTQSQAIHARSWIPIQDTPGVKQTYAATIRVPTGLRAVMSADAKPDASQPGVFAFEMPQPIPSYLIALAVGDLAFRATGPRSGVYAEPELVDKAAAEFADTGAMIDAAEKRFGPYRWGRYDILVLPPSFPFGGMENPKLTFVTPTVIAGDKSLVALVAHELAHSWSGNLVTNATWRDFWLNEGYTTYLERRIVEDVFGPDRAAMEAVLGLQELRALLNEHKPADQILHVDLNGRDPDEGMTPIPYEKGALFLTTLERTFGRPRFDAYLKGYFDRFAFQSLTTAEALADIETHLFAPGTAIDLNAWVEGPGLQAPFVEPHSDRLAAVDAAAKSWLDGSSKPSELPSAAWTTMEWLRFLRALPADLPAARMAELDAAFKLTDRGNAEIVAEWLLMSVRAGYAPADARLDAFLSTVGRRKYVVPLYTALARTPAGLARAKAIYARARPLYHPITSGSVDPIVGRPG